MTHALLVLVALAVQEPPKLDPTDTRYFLWKGQRVYTVGWSPGLLAIQGTNAYDVDPQGAYFKHILDEMKNKRLNIIRQVFHLGQQEYDLLWNYDACTWTVSRYVPTYYKRTGPGTSLYDGKKKYDLTKVNPLFIAHFKAFVQYAAERDIIVVFSIFDSWHLNKAQAKEKCNGQFVPVPRGRLFDAYKTGNNINGVIAETQADFHSTQGATDPKKPLYHQRALVKRVVQEFGHFDNIIWEVSNEVEHAYNGISTSGASDFTAWKNHIANYITQVESQLGKPHHLVMQRDLPDHLVSGGNETYLVPQKIPEVVPVSQLIRYQMISRAGWQRPLIADSDGGWPPTNRHGKRRATWACLTAGGSFTWFGYLTAAQSAWDDVDHQEARRYMGYVRKFLDDLDVDLTGMVTLDHLVFDPTPGQQKYSDFAKCSAYSNNNNNIGWCFGRVGDEFVLYLDSTPVPPNATGDRQSWHGWWDRAFFPMEKGGVWPGENKYKVTGLPQGTWVARWFNPRTGIVQSQVTGSGSPYTFQLPTANTDWVLHVRKLASESGSDFGAAERESSAEPAEEIVAADVETRAEDSGRPGDDGSGRCGLLGLEAILVVGLLLRRRQSFQGSF